MNTSANSGERSLREKNQSHFGIKGLKEDDTISEDAEEVSKRRKVDKRFTTTPNPERNL